MDVDTYAIESQVEQTHWWFVVRRCLIRSIVKKLNLPPDPAILDVGTSTGANLRLLQEMGFTNLLGLDRSPEAIRWCEGKGLGTVQRGDICSIPFRDESFDLILATDIIEHVDDDIMALKELQRVLKKSGRIVITVPTFPSLWGLQDDVAHHKRRYRRHDLLGKLEKSGLKRNKGFYFNFLLFVPVWIARRVIRLVKIRLKSENQINTPLLNRILKAIFYVDIALAQILHPPFGVSLFILASRQRTDESHVEFPRNATESSLTVGGQVKDEPKSSG